MSKDRTLYGIIAEVVARETRYLRHYLGEVVNISDEAGKGRVKCKVPELGLDTRDKAIWCWPRYDGNRHSTPGVGTAVEVYFMNGRVERPVYISGAAELKAVKLRQYENQDSHVLFEAPEGGDYVKYDAGAEELEIAVATKVAVFTELLEVGQGTESFVLGDSLKAYLDSLKAYIDGHAHTGVTTGSDPSGPPGSPSPAMGTVLSATIKGE